MYRLFIKAGIVNILYNAEDLADKSNVHFPKLTRIDAETVDEVKVLPCWDQPVTNKCPCRSIDVKRSTKCDVGSDCYKSLIG